MATSIIDELVTILGFELKPNAQSTVQKFEKGLAAIHKTALVMAGAITAAAASIAYFTEKTTSSAAELDKYSELTGASVEEIQKWGYAAEQAGGSAKSVKQDVEGLLEAMNPVMPGEFNQGLFLLGMYGRKYKDTTELILALSDKLRGMAPMQQMNWAKKAEISPETLLLLKKGRAGIQQLMAQTPFLMGKEQTESARKFEAQISRVKYSIAALGEIVITKTLPVLIKMVDKFENWVQSSQVNVFLQKMIDILSDPKLIGGTIQTALYGIIGATIILEAKWIAIAAAIGLAVLGIKDFIETSKGAGNTLWNRIKNFLDTPDITYTESEAAAAQARIAKREEGIRTGDKSTLMSIWDTASGMIKNLNNASVVAPPTPNPPSVTNNVTNNVSVNGVTTPFETGQEVGYQLGRVKWGDVAPSTR